jgi:hypothetical protein
MQLNVEDHAYSGAHQPLLGVGGSDQVWERPAGAHGRIGRPHNAGTAASGLARPHAMSRPA